ncbi:hypothetical protein F0U44_11490 [Nocardioides humilatus]|uniref:Uncharacterized protein n=1 Tax=Nocardioides humilatus TaxID=2607660 RepID=A0A5B1LHH9_9ACTN|nr:hypothetical protein [Nocardioides humilatus]KAA1419077.1 hypothetical protein F0U44_11490 [Nocardioides humilatus]
MGTLVISTLGALGASGTASGETTVSPTEPGSPPVVRDGTVDISVDRAAFSYYRATTSAAFAPIAATAAAGSTTSCRGDNTAAGGVNNSPRTTVVVTDPTGATVLTQVSPVRNLSLGGFFTSPSNKPADPQPAPGNTNFRGDFTATANYHGMSASLNLDGRPSGTYTVTTTHQNMVRTGLAGACSIGVPGPAGTIVPGPVVETDTFVYRPWQHKFVDVFGNGNIQANVSPAEVAVRIGTHTSGVLTGKAKFYALDGDFALPSDPETCSTDPETCIPAAAQPCDPDAGCTPRLMVTQRGTTKVDGKVNRLQGIFDLETKAFIASVAVDGYQQVMMSLGPNDAYYHDALSTLGTKLSAQGVDLPALLATQVVVSSNHNVGTLSLLNGLQIDPTGTGGGVTLRSKGTVQAGILLDIYANLRLTGDACVLNEASSANGDRRYTPNEDNGYTVRTSDLLPSVPPAGPLGALVGGPIFSIEGDFVGANAPLLNTASAVIGVDTAADEPHGYPVWVEPFISSPTHVANPKRMDYLGTATWSASEKPVSATVGCTTVDFMLGTGVAIFDNPVRVGFDELVDAATRPNPTVRSVITAVDSAAAQAITDVSANPLVADLLEQVVGSLPLSSLD